jgi:hypothetical protein
MNTENEPAAGVAMDAANSTPDPIAQLTRITQSLSGSLMTTIQAIEQLGSRLKAMEEQQRTTQLCAAKALLAIGTIAQDIEDDERKMAVFKTLEEALVEIRRSSGPSTKPG